MIINQQASTDDLKDLSVDLPVFKFNTFGKTKERQNLKNAYDVRKFS